MWVVAGYRRTFRRDSTKFAVGCQPRSGRVMDTMTYFGPRDMRHGWRICSSVLLRPLCVWKEVVKHGKSNAEFQSFASTEMWGAADRSGEMFG